MKSALCLFGKCGGIEGKDGLGKRIDYKMCYESYKEHVIDVNNCDVFIHSWDIDIADELMELYQPKLNLFESQKIFSKKDDNRLYSRWYSTKESVGLKTLHERVHNFIYDWVMIGRLDLLFFKDFDFSKFDNNFFNVSAWNAPPLWSRHKTEPDRINRTETKEGLSDMFFISNSKMIDKFSTCYDYLDKYGISGHYAAWRHVKEIFGEPMEVCKFPFYRWYDFEIYRFKVCGVYK